MYVKNVKFVTSDFNVGYMFYLICELLYEKFTQFTLNNCELSDHK